MQFIKTRIGGIEMKKFEIIAGIIEIVFAIIIYQVGYLSVTIMLCTYGGYHLGKGLYMKEDKKD